MNEKLEKALSIPLKHISDVHNCFEFCTTKEEVETVIGMIPAKFGSFDVEYADDGISFTIINCFVEYGDVQTEKVDYEFYGSEE